MKRLLGRSAQDVTSTFLKCIKVTGSRKYLFWADNCSGQNKNWYLFTLFAKVVNSDQWDVGTFRIKYLHSGHTYMQADLIHGSTGNKLKGTSQIEDFASFSSLCSHAAKNIECVSGVQEKSS